MGLDMYLSARRSIHSFDEAAQKIATAVRKAAGIKFDTGNLNSTTIEIEAAYWRKANAIHGWFVDHVQEGVDNCGHYYVSRKSLQELHDLCASILSGEVSKDVLPPQEGFFFGDVDDDVGYKEDLVDTVDQLAKVLKLPEEWDFQYHSSW